MKTKAAFLVLALAGCSFYAKSAPSNYSPQTHGEPDCNPGRAATADTIAALAGVGAIIAGNIIYSRQCEGGACDDDTRQTWKLAAAVPVTMTLAGSVGAFVGMSKKGRCTRAKQQWLALGEQDRERIVEQRRQEEERKSGALHASMLRSQLEELEAALGAEVRATRSDHILVRSDRDSNLCTSLRWTAAVQAHEQALRSLGVDKVSCMEGSSALWTGRIDSLPGDIAETKCSHYLEAAKTASSAEEFSRVKSAIPPSCLGWIKREWKEHKRALKDQVASKEVDTDAAADDADSEAEPNSSSPKDAGEASEPQDRASDTISSTCEIGVIDGVPAVASVVVVNVSNQLLPFRLIVELGSDSELWRSSPLEGTLEPGLSERRSFRPFLDRRPITSCRVLPISDR